MEESTAFISLWSYQVYLGFYEIVCQDLYRRTPSWIQAKFGLPYLPQLCGMTSFLELILGSAFWGQKDHLISWTQLQMRPRPLSLPSGSFPPIYWHRRSTLVGASSRSLLTACFRRTSSVFARLRSVRSVCIFVNWRLSMFADIGGACKWLPWAGDRAVSRCEARPSRESLLWK